MFANSGYPFSLRQTTAHCTLVTLLILKCSTKWFWYWNSIRVNFSPLSDTCGVQLGIYIDYIINIVLDTVLKHWWQSADKPQYLQWYYIVVSPGFCKSNAKLWNPQCISNGDNKMCTVICNEMRFYEKDCKLLIVLVMKIIWDYSTTTALAVLHRFKQWKKSSIDLTCR